MQTQVCITIDTEFSIAGAFANPNLKPVANPFVWCNVDGRSEGLGFLLDCFKTHRIPATFFVEALHRNYFAHDPMREAVKRIADEGHAVELHAHPCWTVFRHTDWAQRVKAQPKQDDFYGRSEDDSLALIHEGMDVFADWGLPVPRVFRSASLQHDDVLYRAIARSGIPYSSNIGLAIFDSGDPNYRLYAGRHVRHGVVECPILTFSDWTIGGRRHLKSLTISGTSFTETCALLEKAHAAGIGEVIILTHPFEYVQSRDVTLGHARRHAINQRRLTRLCQFLDYHRDRFSAVSVAAAAGKPMGDAAEENPLLSGVLWHAVGRIATQVGYDGFGTAALALTKLRLQ